MELNENVLVSLVKERLVKIKNISWVEDRARVFSEAGHSSQLESLANVERHRSNPFHRGDVV